MQPTYPNGTRVRLNRKLGSLPQGSQGTVIKTVFIGVKEYCHVDFDAVPGDSTILVPVSYLA